MVDWRTTRALKELYDTFSGIPKSNPLCAFTGSYCDEEVGIFNAIDRERATYADISEGMEGWITCPQEAFVYLLPRLFRILLLGQSGPGCAPGAEDNIAGTIEVRLRMQEISDLLTASQKSAVLSAWRLLDETKYSPSGSRVARDLAEFWAQHEARSRL